MAVLWPISIKRRPSFEDALVELLQTNTLLLSQAVKKIADWQDLALASTRNAHDLAVGFRLAQETPELDIRDDLDKIIRELGDQMARLEEQIVA